MQPKLHEGATMADLDEHVLARIARSLGSLCDKVRLACVNKLALKASRDNFKLWFGLREGAALSVPAAGDTFAGLLDFMRRYHDKEVCTTMMTVVPPVSLDMDVPFQQLAAFSSLAPKVFPDLEGLVLGIYDNRFATVSAFARLKSLVMVLNTMENVMLCPSMLPPLLEKLHLTGRTFRASCYLELPPRVTELTLVKISLNAKSFHSLQHLERAFFVNVFVPGLHVDTEARRAWRESRVRELSIQSFYDTHIPLPVYPAGVHTLEFKLTNDHGGFCFDGAIKAVLPTVSMFGLSHSNGVRVFNEVSAGDDGVLTVDGKKYAMQCCKYTKI